MYEARWAWKNDDAEPANFHGAPAAADDSRNDGEANGSLAHPRAALFGRANSSRAVARARVSAHRRAVVQRPPDLHRPGVHGCAARRGVAHAVWYRRTASPAAAI